MAEQDQVEAEELWLTRIAEGDQDAFEALAVAWTARLHSLILRILRDRQQAEEATQDAFVKIWRQAGTFDRSRGRASSWIFSIAHHQAIDRLRASRAHGGASTTPHEDLEAFVQAAPSGVGTWQKLRMEKAIATLSRPHREVVYLAYFEGLSREEMAQRLGVPVGTAKTRLRDALIRLRDAFRDPNADWKLLDDGKNPKCSREKS